MFGTCSKDVPVPVWYATGTNIGTSDFGLFGLGPCFDLNLSGLQPCWQLSRRGSEVCRPIFGIGSGGQGSIAGRRF